MSDYRRGFRLDISFIDHLLVISTNNYNTYYFHTSQNHTKSFPACKIFTGSCLVTVSKNGYSSASGLKSSLNSSSLPIELNLREREREREGERERERESEREREKVGGSERHYIWGGGKKLFLRF
jgi:hypothetical protein